jgi:hypothetical protein
MKQRHHAAGYVYQPRKSDDPTRVQWLIAKQLRRIAKRERARKETEHETKVQIDRR